MKIAIYPPLDEARLAKVREAAAPAVVVNAAEVEDELRRLVTSLG